jgi:hypothetical protein
MTNAELLVKYFKEMVESGVRLGNIEDIEDENLEKLLEYLRLTMNIASRSN